MNRGLLSFSSAEQSLFKGAAIDFCLALILVLMVGILLQTYVPLIVKLGLALALAVVKFLWSTGLFSYEVPLFQKGIVTRLGRIVPSGPDGLGLLPGKPYWLPLGYPIFTIAIKQDVRELTIPFENMQVWAMNSARGGQGAIEGLTSGIVQVQILDPAAYNAVENTKGAVEAIVEECARDVCESRTIEDFICTRNYLLAEEIKKKIEDTLLATNNNVPGRFGVLIKSVTVKKTDNRDDKVKDGWASITIQQSQATARGTDAAARIRRIRNYSRAGVDANRAAALDAVATTGHPGATIGDQRYNIDVGDSLKQGIAALVDTLKRR